MNRLRLFDLLRLSTNSLFQHKGRTVMTLVGVMLGAFLLVVSLSVGQGVKLAVKRTLSFGGQLKVIEVYPDRSADADDIPAAELEVEGEFSEERRERIREKLVTQWQMEHHYRPANPLTEDRLQQIESWQQVERVSPEIATGTRVRIGNREKYTQLIARWSDNPFVSKLVVSGTPDPDDSGRGILMHEFLAYRLGFRSDQELQSLLGQTLRVELSSHLSRGVIDLLTVEQLWKDNEAFDPTSQEQLEKALEQLAEYVDRLPLPDEQKKELKQTLMPTAPSNEEQDDHFQIVETYTIVGLFRSPTDEELERGSNEYQLKWAELILPMRTARSLMSRIPGQNETGYRRVRVTAKDELLVKDVSARLKDQGYGSHSQIEFIEMIQKHVAVITSVMATLAILALFVAALGTSNVMAMSVLERTHEIGIMKAVGAREGTIRAIFLLEGSLVGLAGGIIGVLLGRLAFVPGNAIARWIMSQRGFDELEGTLFAYPIWIMIGVPALAAFMTMLAAYLPARRASRIDPIEALRHD